MYLVNETNYPIFREDSKLLGYTSLDICFLDEFWIDLFNFFHVQPREYLSEYLIIWYDTNLSNDLMARQFSRKLRLFLESSAFFRVSRYVSFFVIFFGLLARNIIVSLKTGFRFFLRITRLYFATLFFSFFDW